MSAAPHKKGVPHVLVDKDATYRRHVVEEDAAPREFSKTQRRKLETKGFKYHDAIQDGGYEEQPISEQEKYDATKRAEALAKSMDQLKSADDEAAPKPVERTVRFEPQPPPAAAAKTATANKSLFPRELFTNPLCELSPEIWRIAQFIPAVREAYIAFLPEIQIKLKERREEPIGNFEIAILRAGLTLRKRTRVALYASELNALCLECTLFGKLDNEGADASEMEAENLGRGVESGEEIPISELPSLIEDRMRVRLFLRPSATSRLWELPNERADARVLSFATLPEATFVESCRVFNYTFLCYSLKLMI